MAGGPTTGTNAINTATTGGGGGSQTTSPGVQYVEQACMALQGVTSKVR